MRYLARCGFGLVLAVCGLWCSGCSDVGGTIFGEVIGRVLTSGGAAADGVTVRLTGSTVVDITDADGNFELRGVPEGNWTVTAEVTGGGQTQLAESALFHYDGRHVVDLGDLRLANAGTGRQLGEVTGQVMDETGRAVLGATVSLVGGGTTVTTVTGQLGGFAFRDVAPGVYTLNATAVDGQQNRYRATRDTVAVGSAEGTRLVQDLVAMIATDARIGGLQGTITDAFGDPLSGARVTVQASLSGGRVIIIGEALSNALGQYVVGTVPARGGGVTLTVTAAGRATVSQAVSPVAGQLVTTDFSLATELLNAQEAPRNASALAATYPFGTGRGVAAARALRLQTLGGRLARFADAADSRLAPDGHLIEIGVTFTPRAKDDTAAQLLYRSHQQTDADQYLLVATSTSPRTTLLVDRADALSVETRYYYRLASITAGGDSSQLSSPIAVTPLSQLVSTAPPNGDTGVALTGAVFTWAAVEGARAYQVMIYPESPAEGQQPVFLSDVVASPRTSYTYAGDALDPLEDYYWTVVAFNSSDPQEATAESYAPLSRFTTQTAAAR